ncbi:proteasome subunit beta [Saccharothrix obliqua]|uniref:proteasome subunit beta n=1 Tax=Saccharothrix obliqua TaxID=2861747 RepID=UPI001C5DF1F0|nr:proteasome subunit beta [Saccharothrix obliqua]MBW4720445.1 proteasome subunit beta [Saccharothrix obliqua]
MGELVLDSPRRWPCSFADLMAENGSSVYALLRRAADPALPRATGVPHGTTLLALHFRDGVVMAADRRATSGNVIAQRDLRKLEPADGHSCVAFAGTVGFGLEMVRLFRLELRHYEKIEGVGLSFPAKVNRLSAMVRDSLERVMAGMAAVPLLAGWDEDERRGRIFTFDVSGAAAEERDFGGAGSGWHFAKGALKKLHRPDLERDEAVGVAVRALFDAADDDSATGGPDVARGIHPTVAVLTAGGYAEVPDVELARHADALVA